MAAWTAGGLHTGSPGPAATASRSRARKQGTGAPVSILRACLSPTSSGMSTRTAPGSGPSRSLRIRLEKADLSAVRPRRTTPTVRPSGSVMEASRGLARNQRKPMG